MTRDRRIEREAKSRKSITTARILSEIKKAEAQIDEDVENGDLEDALFGIGDVAAPALWRGHRSIARGDESGWSEVLEYCWARIAVYAKGGIRSAYSAGEVAPPLLVRLAIEGWTPALAGIAKMLRTVLQKQHGDDRDDLHLAYFASSVAELMATGKTKATGPKGALRELASKLKKPLTAEDFEEACEFQLENSGATEKDGVEFVNFEIDPIWWFAMARARKDLGLETPVPEHPLFSTPFAKLPEGLTFDPKKSALLKRVEEISKLLK